MASQKELICKVFNAEVTIGIGRVRWIAPAQILQTLTPSSLVPQRKSEVIWAHTEQVPSTVLHADISHHPAQKASPKGEMPPTSLYFFFVTGRGAQNAEAHILLHLSTSLKYKMCSVTSLKAPQIYREHPAHQLSLSGWAQLSSLYPLPLGSFINQAREKSGDHLHQFGCLTGRGRQQRDRSGFIFHSL